MSERERERERFLTQDSDTLNKLKIRQICTYVHVFTNLKEIFYKRFCSTFRKRDDGVEDFRRWRIVRKRKKKKRENAQRERFSKRERERS